MWKQRRFTLTNHALIYSHRNHGHNGFLPLEAVTNFGPLSASVEETVTDGRYDGELLVDILKEHNDIYCVSHWLA